MTSVPYNRQGMAKRDELYMKLTANGIAPERAYEMVERAMPYEEEKPQTAPAKAAVPAAASRSRIVGLFAMLIGIPFWLEAARFTRDGWIIFLNWLCDRFGVPWQVPTMPWLVMLALIVLVGLGYSYVEIGKQPIRPPRNWRKDFFTWSLWRFERRWEVWIVWLVLIVSDIGTTYTGARNPDPSGIAVMRDIAAATAPLAAYAIILTFLPDRMVRFGWRSLRG